MTVDQIFGGVTVSFTKVGKKHLRLLSFEKDGTKITAKVFPEDIQAWIQYVSDPDPEKFDTHITNRIKKAKRIFVDLVLWTDRERNVLITAFDHKNCPDPVWLDSEPIALAEFQEWLKTLEF